MIRLLVTAVLLVAATPAAAELSDADARTLLRQATSSWDRGDRIRVVSPQPYKVRWTGWFEGLEGDSALRMTLDPRAPVTVPLRQIGSLEEKVGTKRHWPTGAILGLAVGLGAGLVIASGDDSPKDAFFGDLGDVLWPPIGAGAGLVGGGLIGFFVKTDRFAKVASFE